MKQINNVLFWRLIEEELLYIDKDQNQFCVDFLNNATPVKYDLSYEPFNFFQVPENGFIIVDDDNRPSSIYKENKLLPFDMNEAGGITNQGQDPSYLVLYDGEMDDTKYKVFDWHKGQVAIEAKSPFTIVKDKALSIIDGMLHCYSLNGELNWQYDLASGKKEQIEIKRIIGLYDHELWIQLNDKRFLLLDAITGKELTAPLDLKEMLGLDELAIGEIHLDEESSKIRILAFAYYIEIELATRRPTIKKKFEPDWAIGKGRFYDGDVRAYFIAGYPFHGKRIGNFTTGIFNTDTLEVEWYYTLSGEDKYHFFVGQPQANEKYFGVMDTNNTLNLFER